jgi:superfamily II DNA or RNA helicase
MDMKDKYNIYIYNKYKDLLNAKKSTELDNNDLCKIFEYYSCIKLTEEYKTFFYEYADIDPEFKEENQMTKNDTGIDCSNLIDTIVQCKLRKDTLTWKECATFFGSQNIFNEELNETIVRWKKLIITRNNECKLAPNLQEKHRLFTDKPYNRDELIKYCGELLTTISLLPIVNEIKKVVRDYQKECIDLIISSKENVIISLPTGTGKNFIIVNSLQANKKYLILVPRIILLEQIQDEIIDHNPKLKSKIQLIGDSNNSFSENKDITICVYNSVKIIEEHSLKFHKIFIDEAHHINKPEIYTNEDEYEDEDIDDEDIDDEDIDDEDIDDEDIDDEDIDDEDIDENIDDEEEINTDNDDEINDKSTYIDIINNFTNLNNNVYLSATIDKKEGFKYYEKNIREMINKKYLCDYTINIPVFTDDPTNKNICEYLLKEYRNIIIYCNSQKEGKNINDLLNKLQKKSSEYIDCNTPKKKRKGIIEKYKSGELPFLVNVRILVEGFDAPITKGVCFMHLPSSKTTLIQIIGRALRLHKEKTYATIILPFSSKDDETSITNFMKVMAKNDSRIKKSFENKKLGGYISIEKQNDKDNEKDITDINFKYDLVFDSMGIMKNNEEIWLKRLDALKKYIDENNKRPSCNDKKKIVYSLGIWCVKQVSFYKDKLNVMNNNIIYNGWSDFINNEKYQIYFMPTDKKWLKRLDDVKKYIDENNKRPSTHNVDKFIEKLGTWINTQLQLYKSKTQIMKNDDIYKLWTEFINDEKYKSFFLTDKEDWCNILEKIKNYIIINNKKPSSKSTIKDIKFLGCWLGCQRQTYKSKTQIMKNDDIYKLWTEFINDEKYKSFFLTDKEVWCNNLNKLKKYIDENLIRPSNSDKNRENKLLASWISNQQIICKSKTQLMKNDDIYKLWCEFINDDKYSKYFISKLNLFSETLEEYKKYIDENNKRPLSTDINNTIKKLGCWGIAQNQNYKKKLNNMKNDDIYKLWTEFINDEKYKPYFRALSTFYK